MKRKLIDRCIDWKDKNSQVPLYLIGARGVGKTHLALEFAKSFYQVILYLNFETDPKMNLRLASLNGEALIRELYQYNEQNEKASFLSLPFHDKSTLVELEETKKDAPEDISKEQSTILILDEVFFSDCLEHILLTIINLKLNIPIILINSSNLHPVFLERKRMEVVTEHCYPMDFEEFLQATGNEWYIGVINEHFDSNQPVPEIVHKELLELYNIYMTVGGLPEAVLDYLMESNVNQVAERHRLRYGSMLQDIREEHNSNEALKMKQVIECIPLQLLKKNKKFQYTYIRKGTTRTMYENAIEELIKLHDVLVSRKMTDVTQQKLYLFDTGLLSSMLRKQWELTQSFDSQAIHLALLENSIAQAFASKEYPLNFWESDSSAKVEFVLGKNNLLPVELFLGEKTRSKNLSVFRENYEYDYAVKVSAKNFGYSKNVKYVPYYAMGCL